MIKVRPLALEPLEQRDTPVAELGALDLGVVNFELQTRIRDLSFRDGSNPPELVAAGSVDGSPWAFHIRLDQYGAPTTVDSERFWVPSGVEIGTVHAYEEGVAVGQVVDPVSALYSDGDAAIWSDAETVFRPYPIDGVGVLEEVLDTIAGPVAIGTHDGAAVVHSAGQAIHLPEGFDVAVSIQIADGSEQGFLVGSGVNNRPAYAAVDFSSGAVAMNAVSAPAELAGIAGLEGAFVEAFRSADGLNAPVGIVEWTSEAGSVLFGYDLNTGQIYQNYGPSEGRRIVADSGLIAVEREDGWHLRATGAPGARLLGMIHGTSMPISEVFRNKGVDLALLGIELEAVRDIHTDGTSRAYFLVDAVVNGESRPIIFHVTDNPDAPTRRDPLDVNDDDFISPLDALIVINHLNAFGPGSLEAAEPTPFFLDSSEDGFITPLDALLIINYLNTFGAGAVAQGEPKWGGREAEGEHSNKMPGRLVDPSRAIVTLAYTAFDSDEEQRVKRVRFDINAVLELFSRT